MSIIVRESGFSKETWAREGGIFIDLEKFGQDLADRPASKTCLDISNDVQPESLCGLFENVAMIRVDFPSFADGRGFSIARQLRHLGYKGRLRAAGHVIADQFGFALTCGFDEVEIDESLAERQPEEQWLSRKPDMELSYQQKWLKQRSGRNHNQHQEQV